jgi:hypothetical protein
MSNQVDTETGRANLENDQRSELIKLFGCLHNAVNEKPWDQMKVSGCLLDITTKFDFDDKKIKRLEAACDSLCTERNQFELKYCDEKRKTDDLRILLDANKEMADKMEFQAKKFGIKLKLAILLLNEAAPIMEKIYLRKRWFEGVNELNKVEQA